MKRKNRYSAIIERIFTSKFKPGMRMALARTEFLLAELSDSQTEQLALLEQPTPR